MLGSWWAGSQKTRAAQEGFWLVKGWSLGKDGNSPRKGACDCGFGIIFLGGNGWGCGMRVLEQRGEEVTFAEPTPGTRWEAYLVTDQKVSF